MGKLAVAMMSAMSLTLWTSNSIPAMAVTPGPDTTGTWSVPFQEDPNNTAYPIAVGPTEHCKNDAASGELACKPTAVNSTVLRDGRILYWNGLESLENVTTNTVLQAGSVARNSQARILDLRSGSPVWTTPTPADGGAVNPDVGTGPPWPLPGNNGFNNNPQASGDMFCSDQVALANGKILISGGTAWYQEPQIAPGIGVVELQGLRNSRLFDPATNTFTQVGSMNYGRWYPGLIEMGNGNVFVGGGVRKLIQTDGTNVRNTEIFNANTMTWTTNGIHGDAALPLFPRFHLLPNGEIYYSGVGQMFGPFGESADQALYAEHMSYQPADDSWDWFGIGTFGARSGAFSVLMPLKAPYDHATVLTGGGTLGPPPGSYFSNPFTEISSFDASKNWFPTFSVGPQLNNARWFSSAVVMPNDAVALFNGGTRDEVVNPGTESPVHMAEMYAPWDNQFHNLSSDSRDRTYHNSAVLLPDGSVLVGGHAPIALAYTFSNNILHNLVGTANNFRDPSFEIYKPPYFFKGSRPTITSAPSGVLYGSTFDVATPDASNISSVRLIRLPALTHIVDGNMRSVELPFTKSGDHISVTTPTNPSVVPPGDYYLFINTGTGADTVPSTAAIVNVGTANNATPAAKPFGNGLNSTIATAAATAPESVLASLLAKFGLFISQLPVLGLAMVGPARRRLRKRSAK